MKELTPQQLAWADKRKHKADTDAQVLSAIDGGERPAAVAARLGLSRPRVARALAAAGRGDGRAKHTEIQKNAACELRTVGKTRAEIVAATGMSMGAVKDLFRDRGLQLQGDALSQAVGRKFTWQDLETVAGERGFTLVSPMSPGTSLPALADVKCFCGASFRVYPYDILDGRRQSCGCLKSRPQRELTDLVISWGFDVVSNDTKTVPPLQIDLYIPSKKVGIEFCGLHWHGQRLPEHSHGLAVGAAKARRKHLDKLEACENVGVRLVTVFEDEWNHRRPQAIGWLRASLGLSLERVGARKLRCCVDDSSRVFQFLDDNHLQGRADGETYSLNTVDDTIAAAAVFRRRSDEVWELSRYCVKVGMAVPGGLERLLQAFKKAHPSASSLVTFADRRWSSGGLYERVGFALERVLPPSYWYFCNNKRGPRIHKTNFRKERIASRFGPLLPDETEWEAMKRFGYDRIWDCGYQRWVMGLCQTQSSPCVGSQPTSPRRS